MPGQSNHVAVIGLGAMGLPMAAHLATVFLGDRVRPV
jgi:UDP-N-acetyl-D-mannosaminuronate dehydrogenase